MLDDVQRSLSATPEIREVSLKLSSENLFFDGAQPSDAGAFLALIPVVDRYRPTETAELTSFDLELTTAAELDDIGDVFEASPDIANVRVQNTYADSGGITPTTLDGSGDNGEPLPPPSFAQLTLSREEAAAGNWLPAWDIARTLPQLSSLSFDSGTSTVENPANISVLLGMKIADASESAEDANALWPLIEELLRHHDRVNILNFADEQIGQDSTYAAIIGSCSAGSRSTADGALYEELARRAAAEC